MIGPGGCVRKMPGSEPSDPLYPAAPPLIAHREADYVFPTWRAALADSQRRIADAYEQRARVFTAASDAGLTYRQIGEATGLSAAAVGKIINRKRATLDEPAIGPSRLASREGRDGA